MTVLQILAMTFGLFVYFTASVWTIALVVLPIMVYFLYDRFAQELESIPLEKHAHEEPLYSLPYNLWTHDLLGKDGSHWFNTRIVETLALSRTPAPHVLIIDDDIDLALAMQTALRQLGCETEIATRHEDLHRKITFSDADYILLDWKLNNDVTADRVVEKAARLINTFSDLRRKFSEHKPQIVTYSVLDRTETHLPEASKAFFSHLDHWQKPMPFSEIIKKATSLLTPA